MDGRIFHIKNQLSQNLGRRWTVSEMAAMVDLSPVHLQKLFKRVTGKSPILYLNDLRLEKARELLETSFLQVKQIGRYSGLTDGSHFARTFKKKFGCAPSEYRKKCWQSQQSDPPQD